MTNERIVQRWFKLFRNEKDSFEDENNGNRPSAPNNDKLKVLVKADARTTSRELAKEYTFVKSAKCIKRLRRT